ncbi:hypothetical protein ABW19_dt0204708 [Dactylella cylindrospora]|nr:hypothetical protein ABW19_dt0204708 [Dactylella cylindrospora]
MDPLTALQTAAAIAQFGVMGFHLIVRIKQFKDQNYELPAVLRDIEIHVESIRASLELIREALENDSQRCNGTIKAAVSRCLEQIETRCDRLDHMVAKYMPKNESSRAAILAAFKSISRDSEIREQADRLGSDLDPLMLALNAASFHIGSVGRRKSINSHLYKRRLDTVPPHHVSSFINRDDVMSDIKAQFERNNDGVVKVMVLQGMGGQGKTQLALEYCRLSRLESRFAAMFWVDATSKISTEESFKKIYEVIKYDDQPVKEAREQIEFAKNALIEWKSDWLLVFDNHDNPEEFDALEYFPNSMNGHILVTSRSSPAIISKIGPVREVDGMTEAQSLKLFYSQSKIEVSPEADQEVKEIVKRLGYHPLAVNQTAIYLREKKNILPLSRFLRHYETYTRKILDGGRNRPSGGGKIEEKTVMNIWNMSYDEILQPKSPLGTLKVAFLVILAFFDETDISECLFATFFDTFPEKSDPLGWFELFVSEDTGRWDNDNFGEVVTELQRLSFINSAWTGEDGWIHVSLHPLVRDWIKLRQSKEDLLLGYRTATQLLVSSIRRDVVILPSSHRFGLPVYNPEKSARHYFMSHLSVWVNNWRVFQENPEYLPELIYMPDADGIDYIFAEELLVRCLDYSLHSVEAFMILIWIVRRRRNPEEDQIRRALLIVHTSALDILSTNQYDEGLSFMDLSKARPGLAWEFIEYWNGVPQNRLLVATVLCAALGLIIDPSPVPNQFLKQLGFYMSVCDQIPPEDDFMLWNTLHARLAKLLLEYRDGELVEQGTACVMKLITFSDSRPDMDGPTFRKRFWNYSIWDLAFSKHVNTETRRKLLEEYKESLGVLPKNHVLNLRYEISVARILLAEEKPEMALDSLSKYTDILKSWPVHSQEAFSIWSVYAKASAALGRTADEKRAYVEMLRCNDDQTLICSLLQDLSILEFSSGDIAAGIDTLAKMIKVAEILKDRNKLAIALRQRSMITVALGKRMAGEAFSDASRWLQLYRDAPYNPESTEIICLSEEEMGRRVDGRIGICAMMLWLRAAVLSGKYTPSMFGAFANVMHALSKIEGMMLDDLRDFLTNFGSYARGMGADSQFDVEHWKSIMGEGLKAHLGAPEHEKSIGSLISQLESIGLGGVSETEFPEDVDLSKVNIVVVGPGEDAKEKLARKMREDKEKDEREKPKSVDTDPMEAEPPNTSIAPRNAISEVEDSAKLPKTEGIVRTATVSESLYDTTMSKKPAPTSPSQTSRRRSRISQVFSRKDREKPTLSHLLRADGVARAFGSPVPIDLTFSHKRSSSYSRS